MAGNPFRKSAPSKPEAKIVAVSNRLLESVIKKNNEVALKLLLYIGQAVQKKEAELKAKDLPLPKPAPLTTFTLQLKDVCTKCDVSEKRLKDSVKVLQKTVLSFEDKEAQWKENITVIPRSKYNYGEQTFEVDMYQKVLELVCNLERNLTIIDSTNAMRLNSAYALRFIPILEHIDGYDEYCGKRKAYNLEELNAIFGTNYKSINKINQSVIKGLKEEFDRVSKLSFLAQVKSDVNPNGRGRPVATSIMFDVIKNQPSLF